MAKTITVVLGGVEYGVAQRPIKAAAAWRARLERELAPVVELVRTYDQIEINNVNDLVNLAQTVGPVLLHAPDLASDLFFDYAVELRPQRELIEETAFDDEMLAALWEVAQMAYPFGELAKRAGALAPAGSANGSTPPTLTPISPRSG